MPGGLARHQDIENDVPRIPRKVVAPSEAARGALTDVSNHPNQQDPWQESSRLVTPEPSSDQPSISGRKRTREDALTDASSMPEGWTHAKKYCGVFTRIDVTPNVEHDDLDAEDAQNPLMVPEYQEDIYDLLYHRQERYVVHPRYMLRQPELTWRLRGILMNWLVTVHSQLRLLGETLYLAANLVDRFLDASPEPIPLSKLQLVGITALFTAAKYEEVYVPNIQTCSYVANLSDEEVRDMERHMLRVLDFDLGYVNPLNFLRRISKADDYGLSSRTIAKFLLEISVFDKHLATYRPSDLAAAAMCLSLQILDLGPWNRNFVFYSGGATAESLKPLTDEMVRFLGKDLDKNPDFLKKYASKNYLKASVVCTTWYNSHFASPSPAASPEPVSEPQTPKT